MSKLLLILTITLSMLSISCEESEFSSKDTLSKLSEGTLSVEEVEELTPTEEEIDEVAVQMEEESDMDAIEDVEMVEEVMPIAGNDEDLKVCAKKMKKNKKRKHNRTKVELTDAELAEINAKKEEVKAIYENLRVDYKGKTELTEDEIADVKVRKEAAAVIVSQVKEILASAKDRQNEEVVASDSDEVISEESDVNCAKKKRYKKYTCKSKRHLKEKVMICLMPAGDVDKAQTLVLPTAALKASIYNLAKEGTKAYMGPCKKDLQ